MSSQPLFNPSRRDLPNFHLACEVARLFRLYHRHKVLGLDHVPADGRAMLVINHSMATYDLLLLMDAIYRRHHRYTRTLIDRFFYKIPLLAQTTLRPMGLDMANWDNAGELLENDELILLSPGGMREWRRPSTQRYEIDWEGRSGYARLAIQTQTPIILAACPRADDLFEVYENPVSKLIYEKFRAPFVVSRGWGPTLIPKPVKLTHHLSAQIVPPAAKSGAAFASQVEDFHREVTSQMRALLAKALDDQGSPLVG